MNDQVSSKEPLKHQEEHPLASSHIGAWVAAIILIVLGVAFLVQNFGLKVLPLNNWWAFFILIPAISAFFSAGRKYRMAGNHWTAPARSSLIGGFVLTLLTAGFLFSIDWKYLIPTLIIVAGLSLLSTNFASREK